MNRSAFFAAVRSSLFGGKISQNQVSGIGAILDEAERRGTPLEHVAYILATAYHESAYTMQPVRETLAKTDDAAIVRLDRAYAAGKLTWVKKPYWRKDADGKSWLGRGLVQLTHKANYQKLGLLIGVDLVSDPGKAMEMETSIKIIFTGMELGSFTGKALEDYIGSGKVDYYNARSIINGDVRGNGAKIATQAKAFEAALRAGGYVAVKTSTATKATPELPPRPKETVPGPVVIDRKAGSADWLTAFINAIVGLLKGSKA